ncbi:MAG TPA: nicotinate-nucleotide diphosphorylase (carboxylating), partial [Pirellulaceae bacterium]
MAKEFSQGTWDEDLEHDLRQLIRLAILEDLGREFDWTTVALVPPEAEASACVVARHGGVFAGERVAEVVFQEMGSPISWTALIADRTVVNAGCILGQARGPARDLLTAERILLNFLGRLCGIATLTARFVAELKGLPTRLYDTRKTTPGWR